MAMLRSQQLQQQPPLPSPISASEDTSERLLPATFYDIINAFFCDYYKRVLMYITENPDRAYPLLQAHGEIFKQFEIGDYWHMAKTMGNHSIRVMELEFQKKHPNLDIYNVYNIYKSTPAQAVRSPSPPLTARPPSPLSGPTTICSERPAPEPVDSWLEKVGSARGSSPDNKNPIHDSKNDAQQSHSETNGPLRRSSRRSTAGNDGGSSKSKNKATSLNQLLQPQRKRYARSTKARKDNIQSVKPKKAADKRTKAAGKPDAGVLAQHTEVQRITRGTKRRMDVDDVPTKRETKKRRRDDDDVSLIKKRKAKRQETEDDLALEELRNVGY